MLKTAILKAALFTPMSKGRWGLPLLQWSAPGEGKTSVIEEMCASYGLPCVTLSPGEMGEGAFGVIPVPDQKGSVIRYPAPEWIEQVRDGGVVFIDEMSSTPPALQPPLLGLLFAARIGGTILGPRVRRIGAANPPEIAASGFELAPPVANRCGHIDWEAPSVDEHAAYMLRGNTGSGGEATQPMNAKTEEERVLAAWPEAWAVAVGLETAFLRRRPELKNQCPKAGDVKAGRAWPSDRSWENATRALAASTVHGLTPAQREEFVSAFIGAGPGGEFFTFIAEADLPNPADLLDGKVSFKHNPVRLDRTAAVLSACVALVTPAQAQHREKRLEALWTMLGDLVRGKADMDVLVPSAMALAQAHLLRKASTKVLSDLNSLLRAANVQPGR